MSEAFEGLTTPAAILDLDRLERNAAAMARRAKALGVALRPHVKTHKSVDVGRVQTGESFGGVTVSTYAEAAAFAEAGFRDITWAVPIAFGRIPQAAELARHVERLNLLADHPKALDGLEAHARAAGLRFDVLLKIDCGNHRAGVDPDSDDAVRLAQRVASSPYLRFRGVLAHAGHAYDARSRSEVEQVARQERDATVGFAERVRAAGVPVETVSIGSTPTIAVATSLPGVTEIRPGNYAFFDVFQATLGSCALDDIALSVLSTVVGVYPDRNTFVIDAGALALSKDPGPKRIDAGCGYGVVLCGDRDTRDGALRVTSLTQEHGVVFGLDRAAGVEVGSRVHVLPNHSCLTAACFASYVTVRGMRQCGAWPLARGWDFGNT